MVLHNSAPVKTVVVDNGSREDERRLLAEVMDTCFPDGGWTLLAEGGSTRGVDTVLLQLDDNVGYARGNNAGLRVVEDDDEVDRVMVLNNDILFVEDIIPRLIACADALPQCAVMSPVLYKKGMEEIDYNCARRNASVGDIVRTNLLHYFWRMMGKTDMDGQKHRYLLKQKDGMGEIEEIELPSGACMLVGKRLFKEMGYFDPGTFLYYEENILYAVTRRLGRKNYLCTTARCIHLGAATMAKMPASLALVRHMLRSERYYVARFSGASWGMRLLHKMSQMVYWWMLNVQKRVVPCGKGR